MFPSSFGNLKLHVLDITACSTIKHFPPISKMTSVKQHQISAGRRRIILLAECIRVDINLPGCTIHDIHETGDGECSDIVELGKLTCHDLEVRHVENVKHPDDAERAKLRDNPELRKLTLRWTHEGRTTGEKDAEMDQLVLENLIPPRTLEHLKLEGYMSKDFPNWMFDISSCLPYLTSIQLSRLTTCDSLPPFGQLPNLRYLR
uniref:R13L1/DRL21-like LRR repeat region domain-containing protein n=1 Tax=Arundo donax TaxID=35708 RepID=A0A0A9GRD1_ARUDO